MIGASKKAVSSARTRIEIMLHSAERKLDYTHFISLPLNIPPILTVSTFPRPHNGHGKGVVCTSVRMVWGAPGGFHWCLWIAKARSKYLHTYQHEA